MEAVFLKLLNLGINASYLALAVIVLRLLLRKAPKNLRCILWGLVALRLVLPFSLESVLSLIPSAEPVPQEILLAPTPEIQSGIPAVNHAINPILSQSLSPMPGDSVNPMQIIVFAASIVWIAGVAAMLFYMLASYLRLRKTVREAVILQGNVLLCDKVATPFLMGLLRPRIYLPSSMEETDMQYVLLHENTHLKRGDHIWKLLGFLLLAFYWFHPILWAAYFLFCRDIELACDEKVLKSCGPAIKKPYSEALLHCSATDKTIAACPLAFGLTGVKARIKNVLHYKKPSFWIVLFAVVLSASAAVCLLTDPVKREENNTLPHKSAHTYKMLLPRQEVDATRFQGFQPISTSTDTLPSVDLDNNGIDETYSIYVEPYLSYSKYHAIVVEENGVAKYVKTLILENDMHYYFDMIDGKLFLLGLEKQEPDFIGCILPGKGV